MGIKKIYKYNPDLQYRCTIIRGKSISRMDDFLPIYVEILRELCPISANNFADEFDTRLSKYIKDDHKTIKNHRTENVFKLLGLVFVQNDIVYLADRTKRFIEDGDQPALFKSVCYQFQQPNGSQKINTIAQKIVDKVSFRPYHFILSLLQKANTNNVILTKYEIAYYVLNSLHVLQGNVSVDQVFTTIISDRFNKITKKITIIKNYAWSYQHIKEQFDYLKLANLIREDEHNIWLNIKEQPSIDYFIDDLNNPLAIDYSKYNLNSRDVGKTIEFEWQEYFCNTPDIKYDKFKTLLHSLDAVISLIDSQRIDATTSEIGHEGEHLILEFEKNLVKSFNPRLANKVNYLGKTKGLGYDIISIEASRNTSNPEFMRYIEVKSTTRVSPPNFTDTWDSIFLTRNEWVAAEQHSTHFYIYRIYFTNSGTFISIIQDPVTKFKEGLLYATPINYRLEFTNVAVDEQLELPQRKNNED